MTILALDTSTHWLSVAVGDADGWVTRDIEVGPGHSGQILPLVQEALREAQVPMAQLQTIAFGAGPGSFTGVRIACGVAQGLALGLTATTGVELPLVPVCGLQAIAEMARQQYGATQVWAALDARMKEIYAAAWYYSDEAWHEVMPPQVGKPEDVVAHLRALIEASPMTEESAWSAAGDALLAYPLLQQALPWQQIDGALRPQAKAIGMLALRALRALARGETVHARDAAPMYVRQRVALTSAERAAGEVL